MSTSRFGEECPCGSTQLLVELRDSGPMPDGSAPPRESYGEWIVCERCGRQWPAIPAGLTAAEEHRYLMQQGVDRRLAISIVNARRPGEWPPEGVQFRETPKEER